eukprot:7979320-Alexandrium_andersonii.AAC.1
MEAFSPPRVTAVAERRPRYRALPAGALDLRPGPGGQSWNSDLLGDRERAIRLVASSQAVPADWQPA